MYLFQTNLSRLVLLMALLAAMLKPLPASSQSTFEALPNNGKQGVWMDLNTSYHVFDSLMTFRGLRFYTDTLQHRADSLNKAWKNCDRLTQSQDEKLKKQEYVLDMGVNTVALGVADLSECNSDKNKLKAKVTFLQVKGIVFEVSTAALIGYIIYGEIKK